MVLLELAPDIMRERDEVLFGEKESLMCSQRDIYTGGQALQLVAVRSSTYTPTKSFLNLLISRLTRRKYIDPYTSHLSRPSSNKFDISN